MERPSLERYRQLLAAEGIDLSDEELRALRRELRSFSRLVVSLFEDRRKAEGNDEQREEP